MVPAAHSAMLLPAGGLARFQALLLCSVICYSGLPVVK